MNNKKKLDRAEQATTEFPVDREVDWDTRRRQPPPNEPGSIEQHLDMVESGPLRGDEILHHHGLDPVEDVGETVNFNVEMSEEDREGSEMSGDEHSAGLQGDEPTLRYQDHIEAGVPGEEELKAERIRRRRDSAA